MSVGVGVLDCCSMISQIGVVNCPIICFMNFEFSCHGDGVVGKGLLSYQVSGRAKGSK